MPAAIKPRPRTGSAPVFAPRKQPAPPPAAPARARPAPKAVSRPVAAPPRAPKAKAAPKPTPGPTGPNGEYTAADIERVSATPALWAKHRAAITAQAQRESTSRAHRNVVRLPDHDDGDPWVLMLNRDGAAVPVIAKLVPERILDGYSFIDGVAAIPRVRGPQSTPERSPRRAVKCDGLVAATVYWEAQMIADRGGLDEHPDYRWEWLERIRTIFKFPPGTPGAEDFARGLAIEPVHGAPV